MGFIVRQRYNQNSALTRSVITRLQCMWLYLLQLLKD